MAGDDGAQHQYVGGQMRPAFGALLADFEQCSATALAREPCTLDIRYGERERETFDFFPSRTHARATLAFFHASYWQSRDKATFRWLAPMFTPRGLHVALVNYALCPSVTLRELVEGAMGSAPAVRRHAANADGRDLPLIVAGHSAGAHLAAEIGLAGRADGVVGVSGIYDLAPLVGTTLNDKLRLDEARARAMSPLHRVRAGSPPALFIVGADETRAFIEQNRRMHEAWRAAGSASEEQVVLQADHFTVLQAFAAPEGAVADAIESVVERGEARCR